MEQLYLFNSNSDSETNLATTQKNQWTLFCDGASRNNPGPAGAGIYIEKNDVLVLKDGFYLGTKTNNQAEYFAVLIGLFLLQQHMNADDTVRVISDSQLLVRQLNGEYKVRQPHLKPLHSLAQLQLSKLHAEVSHVLREENTIADKMANKGVDEKRPLPDDFVEFLTTHEIKL